MFFAMYNVSFGELKPSDETADVDFVSTNFREGLA